MTVFYKATRPDGTDFRTGTVEFRVGKTVSVSRAQRKLTAVCCTNSVLHASVVPAETLLGGSWPCRLFEVSGRPVAEEGSKRGFRQFRVLAEIESHHALGPQGIQLASLIGQAQRLTLTEAGLISAAWDTAWEAAWAAAWDTARGAAWDTDRGAACHTAWEAARAAACHIARAAAWDTAWAAAWDTARAAAWAAAGAAAGLVVRDLIGSHGFTQKHYNSLTGPWASVMGPVHPDDKAETR